MSWIAGIDFSSFHVDVVLIEEDDTRPPVWHRTSLAGVDAFDRCRRLQGDLLGEHQWDDVLAVGIEEPRGHNPGVLYRVQGAVLAHIPCWILAVPWVPSEWRKAVGLPGNASKSDVAGWALGQPDAQVWRPGTPQDAFDAYAIATATRRAITVEAAA